SGECGTQTGGTWRRSYPSVQDIVSRDGASVIMLVGTLARANHRAFERNAGEQTFASTVTVNGRPRRDVSFRRTANRSGGNACICSERDVTSARKRAHRRLVVEH